MLPRQGLENINLIIRIYPDVDHIGGIENVIVEIEIEFIWNTPNKYTLRLYGRIKKSAGERRIRISHPHPGYQY